MILFRYVIIFAGVLFTSSKAFGQTQPAIPEYANILSRYIQFSSTEFKEKEAGLFLLKLCEQKGLKTEILSKGDSSFNFIASIYPLSLGKPNIVFLNHIDVVSAGDTSLWKYPPYSGTIQDSIIWGRGALDNKGMAIAQLLAIEHLVSLSKNSDLPYNISLLSVSGEETGGSGARYVVDKFLDKINPVLVLGEGGSGVQGLIQLSPEKIVFGISTTEKSRIVLNLEMDLPSSGHGSIPPKEYAMKEMIFALEKLLKKRPRINYNSISVKGIKTLGKHEKGIRGFIQEHFTFIAFKPLVKGRIKNDPMQLSFFANTITFTNLTIPDGNTNQISQVASATFDCRLLPDYSTERFLRMVQKSVKDERITIKVVQKAVQAEKTSSNSPYYKSLNFALDKVFPNSLALEMIFPASTDNNYFRAKGIPVLGIFPASFSEVELRAIHNIDEQIHFNRLEKAIELYKTFLEDIITKELTLTVN